MHTRVFWQKKRKIPASFYDGWLTGTPLPNIAIATCHLQSHFWLSFIFYLAKMPVKIAGSGSDDTGYHGVWSLYG